MSRLPASSSWSWTATADQSGGNSDDGTAVITFDQVISQIRFQYRNVLTDGESQWIGFSSMNFRKAPEPSSGWLVALGQGQLRRRRHGVLGQQLLERSRTAHDMLREC